MLLLKELKKCIIQNTILKKIKLIEENGEYLLDIDILVDSKFETERHKAVAKLPITSSSFSITEDSYGGRKMINIGFDNLPCISYIIYETEKKERIMTLAEIENKLGYKIKLVNEEQH